MTAPLTARLEVAGIAVKGPVPAGVQVVAELPDGSTEPLIWVIDPKAAAARSFAFRERRLLPAGTKVVASKPGGSFRLLLAGPGR